MTPSDPRHDRDELRQLAAFPRRRVLALMVPATVFFVFGFAIGEYLLFDHRAGIGHAVGVGAWRGLLSSVFLTAVWLWILQQARRGRRSRLLDPFDDRR